MAEDEALEAVGMIYEHARVSHSEGEASSLLGCVENLADQVALDIVDNDEE